MGIGQVKTSEGKHEKSRRHDHKKHKRHHRRKNSGSSIEDVATRADLEGQAVGQMIIDAVAATDKKQEKSRRHRHKQEYKRHHSDRDSDVEDGASLIKRKRRSRSSDVEEMRREADAFERRHAKIRRPRSRNEENEELRQLNRSRHYSPEGEYWRARDRHNFRKSDNFTDELESYKMSRTRVRNVRVSQPNSEVGKKNNDKSANKEKKNSEPDLVEKESANGVTSQDPKESSEPEPAKNKKEDILTMRTGGAYIPPARLRAMQAQITDKSSAAYQRIAWEALKKSINGLVNKVNVSNIIDIVRELFQENIVRGRGLLSRSIIQAQAGSPTFTHVYAALVAIINTKFPQIGELILRRLIILFRKAYKRNDKATCLSCCKFIAHLVNQQVAHEVLSLEILTLLLENPTDDSVEVAVGFIKEVGSKLTEVSPRGVRAIYDRMRSVLHEGKVDARVQYMIEIAVQVRKDAFKDFPSVLEELQKVKEDDQFTHMLTLEEAGSTEDHLNVFKHDPDYEANEEKYKAIRKELLEESSSDEEGSDDSGSDDDENSDESGEGEQEKTTVIDNTETNLIALRRNIYLTIQSSLDFEECAHKLLKLQLKPGQETELCHMILDCCAQQRTYEKFYGLLAQRFCTLNKIYIQPFQDIFAQSYETIHRLETNKLRNVAKFYGHLLYTDAISWEVMQHIKMNEDDTTSSSRIFVKILFQELAEYMGIMKLNERLKDPMLQVFFEGLLPRDNPRNTRFSINFFTSIGLGGLTDELREHLKNAPKPVPVQEESSSSSSSSSDDNESSEDSSPESDSSSSSEGSEGDSSDSSEASSEEVRKSKRSNTRHSRR